MTKELKGTKTEANLWTAFAGESQARNKYTYYASKAKKDGYVQIAALFEETAANEKEHANSVIRKALNKSFAPEFINRLDEIVTFDQLDIDSLEKIINIELKGLYDRIEGCGYRLLLDPEAKRFVAEKGYDVQFGARPLKRAIQNHLEDGLAELILNEEPEAGDTLHVSLNAQGDGLEMKVEKATKE